MLKDRMDLKELEKTLEKEGIKIIKRSEEGLVPELFVDGMPEPNKKYTKDRAWQRNYFLELPPFFIKDRDWGKTGFILSEFEDIKTEVSTWKNNPNIPIAPKIAILIYGKRCFLVEKCYEEFDELEWDEGLIKRMEELKEKLNNKYEIDCKEENFVYDREDDKLFLIDICVVEEK